MGKISDLWKKIKGMFNKNKALPEGRYNMEIVDNQYETEKESGHEVFLKELQSKAKEFDPGTMLKEDAIMKILEEKGMSEEFAKNPVSKSEIVRIALDILESNGIERITKENLEEVKWRIVATANLDNEWYKKRNGQLQIQEDGSIKYIEEVENKGERWEAPEICKNSNHFFIEDGNLKVQEFNRSVKFIEKDENGLKTIANNSEVTILHEYNKNGLEMKKDVESLHQIRENGKELKSESEKYGLTRMPDLVTAQTYSQRNGIEQGATVPLFLEHPEILNTRTNFNADNVKKMLEKGKATYENGFIENYASFENDIDKKERVEKQNQDLKKLREDAIKMSPEFRKTAIENGLVKEESLEQE